MEKKSIQNQDQSAYQRLTADDELLSIFQEEATELCEQINQVLENEKVWENAEHLNQIARALHTLKGGSQLIGYPGLATAVHALELLFKGKQSIQSEKQYEKITSQTMQYIQDAVSQLHTRQGVIPPKSLIEQLQSVKEDSAERVQADEKAGDDPQSNGAQANHFRLTLEEAKQYTQKAHTLMEAYTEIAWKNKTLMNELEYCKSLLLSADLTLKKVVQESESGDEIILNRQEAAKLQTNFELVLHYCDKFHFLFNNQDTHIRQQQKHVKDLNEMFSKLMLGNFKNYIPRLQKTVQHVAKKLGKYVDLQISQSHVEVDKSILEKLMPAFDHLLRNAIDHGIESPLERLQKNKLETGTINISLHRETNQIVFLISDDGCGINEKKIQDKARAKNLISEGDVWNPSQVLDFIIQPNFSTKEEASEISGRGMGMSTCYHIVKGLQGEMKLASQENEGTTIKILLPVTQSLETGLIFKTHNTHYSITATDIIGVVVLTDQEKDTQRKFIKTISYANKNYPLYSLSQLFGQPESYLEHDQNKYGIVLYHPRGSFALGITEISGIRDIVIKPLPKELKKFTLFQGIALLAETELVYCIELDQLAKHIQKHEDEIISESSLGGAFKSLKTILIVDDSKTIHLDIQKALRGMKVNLLAVESGQEAFRILKQEQVDVILLDIEMPNMNGFEVLKILKQDEVLKSIPVILMSTKEKIINDGHAMAIGVTQFIAKVALKEKLKTVLENVIGEGNHGVS